MKENEDPKPGSAPEPVAQPKPVKDNVVTFSFNQMIFHDYFIVENRRYCRFYLDIDKPCYLDCFYGEYTEFQLAVWEAKFLAAEAGECSCDLHSPDVEPMDELELTITLTNEETEKSETIVKKIPVYFAYDLCSSIKVGGICPPNKD